MNNLSITWSPRVTLRRGVLALAVALTLAGATPAMAANFGHIKVVGDGVASSMTVDDLGHVHIVTGLDGGGLDYDTDASGHWTTQHIAGASALMPSVAVSGGKVYIAFARSGGAGQPGLGIRLLTNRTGPWTTTTITTGDDHWPSLRMRDGEYAIAYQDALGVRYASDLGGTHVDQRVWLRGTQLDMTDEHAPVSLALDAAGRPRVAFERQKGNGAPDGIGYARRVSGAWTRHRVASGTAPLDRIVVDGHDRARIGYGSSGRFRITTYTGDTKTTRTLPGSGFGTFTLDEHGYIQLLRVDEGTDHVTLLRQKADGWHTTTWSDKQPRDPAVRADAGTAWVVYDRCCGGDPGQTVIRVRH